MGDELAAAADRSGVDRALLDQLAASVHRRTPPEELSDPAAIASHLAGWLRWITPRPGGQVRVARADTPTTVVEVHVEDRRLLRSTVTSTVRWLGHDIEDQLHPVLGVVRDDAGRLVEIVPARTAEHREALIHLELSRRLDDDEVTRLEDELAAALADLARATDDYPAMGARLRELAADVRAGVETDDVPEELRAEVADLLEWIEDGNLVLLGTQRVRVADDGTLEPLDGLGVLREDQVDTDRDRLVRADARLLRFSRTRRISRVQRRARMDRVEVLHRADGGGLVGVTRILGIFTRGALAQPARTTPVLRRRLQRLLIAQDVVPDSHDEAAITEVFESLPRDELFRADEAELSAMVLDLVAARDRDEVAAVTRPDAATHTVSVVVTVPHARYGPPLRRAVSARLARAYAEPDGTPAQVVADVTLGDTDEVLLRLTVQVPDEVDLDVLDAARATELVAEVARGWEERAAAAVRAAAPSDAERLLRVLPRLPDSYRDRTDPDEVLEDVRAIVELSRDLDVRVAPADGELGHVRSVSRAGQLELSTFIPLLEHLGLEVVEEHPHVVPPGPDDDRTLHLQDFLVRGLPASGLRDQDVTRVADTLRAVVDGHTDSDALHALVLSADLTWREVALLRAYRRYRRQVGTAYTEQLVAQALTANPDVAAAVVAYFHTRFDPEGNAPEDEVDTAREAALAACDPVERLDHDRILRDIIALVGATLRTSFHAPGRDDVVALKLDPSRVPAAPSPVPYAELFVHSPRVEAVHLRFGPLARGGLRWSDREDDVRTEILGLVEAQVRKNALIVPTGAKGGFVLRRPPADRVRLPDEVRERYETFVRAMLAVTDDLDGDEVVSPPGVRRWDGDDPYLVVAADRGTAELSDVANRIAEDEGFWLRDAFASGGSTGYDHKALGITARGAWVAVRRHLLELGLDPEHDPVTVAGIGDMSGDVFGNGMLSSRTIRLVAAFDHRDVFVDPDPDPAASFAERRRLFDRQGSTWQDYDRDVLSTGGMIVPRTRKRVELTKEVRELLRLDADVLDAPQLVAAVLAAPVDLLWAGGIGTYVKAAQEPHVQVGDRVNDEVRIDAERLRARVVAEGANLALTQQARIAYARRGGRIDQDAIHNVGGVDCSDREVNLKILLESARRQGVIDDAERVALLDEVTDDVVAGVLRDVDLQVWRLSRDAAEATARLDDVEQLLGLLNAAGLDRVVEDLPEDAELRGRREAGAGLTRPELASVLAHGKRLLTDEVLGSGLPDAAAADVVLEDYVPPVLARRFAPQLRAHRLRRELVATRVASELVDRMGPTFAPRVAAESGTTIATVASAWWVGRCVAGIDPAWRALEAAFDTIGPQRQDELALELERLHAELTRRYLADPGTAGVDRLVARDADVVAAVADAVYDLGTDAQRARRRRRTELLTDDLVEPDLARFVACVDDLAFAPDVGATLRALGRGVEDARAVTDTLLQAVDALGLGRLQRLLDAVPPRTTWRRRLRRALATDLRGLAARATELAVRAADGAHGVAAIDALRAGRRDALERARRTVKEVCDDDAGLDGVGVALRALRGALEGEPTKETT